jgi:hypothetical protein
MALAIRWSMIASPGDAIRPRVAHSSSAARAIATA